MVLEVRLLGAPEISVGGVPRRLGGRKPWGLLAYLLLDGPAARVELAHLLFPEADAPLGALRWTLLQVRRALDPGQVVEDGAGLRVELPEDAAVDAPEVLAGPRDVSLVERMAVGELLGGLAFDDAPRFETWLLLQRTRLGSACADALRWAATELLGRDPVRALALAERGIRFAPFDDGLHELAVELHAAIRGPAAALAYLEQVEREYRRELGAPAPATLRRPLDRPPRRAAAPVPARSASRALLESARWRLTAGDAEGAVDAARRAASEAAGSGDARLELKAVLLLASVLIHTHRGHDREALGLLATAGRLARELDDLATQVDVEREVAFVACIDGRYGAAEAAFARSFAMAGALRDELRMGKASTYLGLCRTDRGDAAGGDHELRRAAELLERAGDLGWLGYALGMLARAVLHAGRPQEARELAAEGLRLTREAGWIAMVPWPMTVLAEATLSLGDLRTTVEVLGEALTLSREVADPCWEGLSLRGFALCERAGGRTDRALQLLREGLAAVRRFNDVWKWSEAAILTDLVELDGGSDATCLADALELVVRAPMQELARRLLAFPRAQTLLQTRSR